VITKTYIVTGQIGWTILCSLKRNEKKTITRVPMSDERANLLPIFFPNHPIKTIYTMALRNTAIQVTSRRISFTKKPNKNEIVPIMSVVYLDTRRSFLSFSILKRGAM